MKNCPSCGVSVSDEVVYCPSCGTKINQSVEPKQKRVVPNDGLKHYMVGTATFVHCTTVSEFNKLIKKVCKLCSPQLINMPNYSFSLNNGTNFLTDGNNNNMRIEVSKNGASMFMKITIESINGTDLDDNVNVMNQLFTKLGEVCEAAPFPEDKKTGKARKVKPTLDHIDEPQEQFYDPRANAGDDNSDIAEKIKSINKGWRFSIICFILSGLLGVIGLVGFGDGGCSSGSSSYSASGKISEKQGKRIIEAILPEVVAAQRYTLKHIISIKCYDYEQNIYDYEAEVIMTCIGNVITYKMRGRVYLYDNGDYDRSFMIGEPTPLRTSYK